MKWNKHKVESDKIDKFAADYMVIIRKGVADNLLEHFYCVYKYANNPIIYINSIFDFLDEYPNIKIKGAIEKFYSYQVLNS